MTQPFNIATRRLGAPWRPDGLTFRFTKTVRALGLPTTDIKGFRHAHATALLKAGVHPKVVQERLGHASIKITMDIYSSGLPACSGKPSNGLQRWSAGSKPGR